MNEVKQILLLYCQNTPIKQIARQLGMSRNTVKSYIKRFESSGLSEQDFIEMSCPELQGKLSFPLQVYRMMNVINALWKGLQAILTNSKHIDT